MLKTHPAPLLSVAVGLLGMLTTALVSTLSVLGWATGAAYLVVSNALLLRGLLRRRMSVFGWANWATLARSTMIAVVTALVATSFTASVPVPLLVVLASGALALDAVDGWLARRTHSASELGARFDMEVDAYLLLVLSVAVARELGWWVLVMGLLYYAFATAGLLLPWMRATLPPRYWRKVVTAVAGIALVVAASGILPSAGSTAVTLLALALLVESFARDVLWLIRHRPH